MQNMLLAPRALGLDATLTTLYLQFEKEAEAALGLPPNVHSYSLLPIGYPRGRFAVFRSPMSSTKISGASLFGANGNSGRGQTPTFLQYFEAEGRAS